MAQRYDSGHTRSREQAEGKSQDEVLAAKPTADYDAKVPNSAETTQRFVRQLYAELKPAK
jgi:hypothetical protein